MKTKKNLKFSKETVVLLDNASKKMIKGGLNQPNYLNSAPSPQCIFTRGC